MTNERAEMHPSCIKVPVTKESSLNQSSATKDIDIREQLCTRNDLITMANEVFGSNKWSHTVTNQTLDFVEYVTGKYYVGCAAFVKVQLGDGSFHEDLGYSNSEGPNKGLVIFSARTGSITNALKNTLLCFGGEISTKIKNFTKITTDEPNSLVSIIGQPQLPVIRKRISPPQAQSTPEEKRSSSLSIAPNKLENDEQSTPAVPPVNNERKLDSPKCVKPVESKVQVEKAALTEEKKRLERKRRQAQKQEEYRKLLKEKESFQKPNARF